MRAHRIWTMDENHSPALTHIEETQVKAEEDPLYIAYANTYTRIDISSESGADLRGEQKEQTPASKLNTPSAGVHKFQPLALQLQLETDLQLFGSEAQAEA